ncbi:hypothetical protein ABKV19_008401 [Rosa sericea]
MDNVGFSLNKPCQSGGGKVDGAGFSSEIIGFRGELQRQVEGWWVGLCDRRRRDLTFLFWRTDWVCWTILATTSGSAVLRSDQKAPIWFGLLGSDPEIRVVGRAGDLCWHLENDGRRERWPAIAWRTQVTVERLPVLGRQGICKWDAGIWAFAVFNLDLGLSAFRLGLWPWSHVILVRRGLILIIISPYHFSVWRRVL